MDKILINTIRFDAVNSVTEAKYKFQNSDERQKYINTQIQLQTKILGLDEPWYSPKRIANTRSPSRRSNTTGWVTNG